MKQKRKVKSLLPSENDGNKSLFTSILLVLWVTLCLWSASLMTTSVWAAGLSNNSVLPFTGLDDKSMNIYRLDFGNPENLEGIVSEMYLDTNSTLHVSPSNVIITSDTSNNEVTDGVYWNILWGNNNKIKSNNVTLIAWEGIDVSAWNNNATVLLWKQKNPYWSTANNWAPLVVVWWDRLEVGSNHNGVVIIWWYENKIWDNVTNWIILWWENNKVSSNWGIVWWKNVNLQKAKVFAYSNSSSVFEPKTEKAFYLNLDEWVWIDYDSVKKWVSVNWVIAIADVDISNNCNSTNYWLVWSYNWCLVWCTKWTVDSRWELLDRWKKCEQMCRDNSSKCYFKEEPSETPTPDYTSFCTAKTVGNAHMCNNVTNLYKNVVFESKLIDSEAECPAEHDKCIFQCDKWSHIFYDDNGKPSCKLDCLLPWSESWEKIKHNEEVETTYNVSSLSCSNDAWKSPIPESCVSHKKSLVCNNGVLYEKGTNKKAVDWTKWYMYTSCNLTSYKCDVSEGGYNLTSSNIKDTISSWNDTDRWETNWTRWVYKLCKDYNSNWYDVCTATDKHYKLVKCQNWYSTWATHPYECKAKCSFDWAKYDHWQEILWYKSASATCPSACESTTLTCNDWKWDGDATTYNRKTCSLSVSSCPSTYDVESAVAMKHRDHSIYNDGCQVYSSYGNKHCVKWDLVYDLVWCAPGYHTESKDIDGNDVNNKYCVPDTRTVACTRSWAPEGATYDSYNVEISWMWSWNNWYWTTAANCTWYCGGNTHLENGACVSNLKSVSCNTNWVTKPTNASWNNPVLISWRWSWNDWHWDTVWDCGYSCTSWEYPSCEEEDDDDGGSTSWGWSYSCCSDPSVTQVVRCHMYGPNSKDSHWNYNWYKQNVCTTKWSDKNGYERCDIVPWNIDIGWWEKWVGCSCATYPSDDNPWNC